MRFYSEILGDVVLWEVSFKHVSSYVTENKRSSEAGSEKQNGVPIEGVN